jgi:phosphoglycerate kinase
MHVPASILAPAAAHAVLAPLAGRRVAVAMSGGVDSSVVAALAHAGVTQDFSFISTAGGAFLEWMEGKELPGVAALSA